ncbi:Flp pilus assembly protein CpaB [Erythrobacteraceae bacterium CFH 75059]|uniref:Flp pilus assembly protein CpaB n=1 Tax=Qipengyuania thermophila TaxID=2509361 RepID=UPI001021BACB|nr:Flp pilus assembly protein CpaB [Qipengyuania thermophila]TCD06219.1 Flp pilus assembly protein CpaB [Erythrobacteraceae bacterium CFH 75059]
MDKKKLVLLIGALIVAVGTAMVARSMFAGAAAPTAQAATTLPQKNGPRVLVAQRALPAGTIITAEALRYQEWPDELVQDAYFLDGNSNIEALLGTVVRFPITAGQPVTQGALVKPGERGFLAAALGPGMRAVTVPVSDETGVAGFVFPGDRVDLVLTQSVDGDNGESLKAAETILRNVRVLATDQSMKEEKNELGEMVAKTSRTVTLEVTPRIAEKVAVAQSLGTISLSLRSLTDTVGSVEEALASGDVQIPANATPEEEERILRRLASRPQDTRGTYSTGGDVSRFQRRTLPPRRGLGGGGSEAPVITAQPAGYAPAAAPGGQPAEVRPTGPIVRVARGNTTTAVPVK